MSPQFEFCCYFTFPKENTEQFKNLFKEYMIQTIDDSTNQIYILNEYYKIINGISIGRNGFCAHMRFIKFKNIEPSIVELIKFFKELRNSINLKYEARELCTEYILFGDYCEVGNEFNNPIIYVNCTLNGIPETNDIKLLDWLKT